MIFPKKGAICFQEFYNPADYHLRHNTVKNQSLKYKYSQTPVRLPQGNLISCHFIIQ